MYDELADIAEREFGAIVTRAQAIGRRAGVPLKLRLFVRDGTYVDVWLSPDQRRFVYHWEQRAVRGLIHRHDNAPDHPHVSTHPKHFHNGDEATVEASYLPDEAPAALRMFLRFVEQQLAVYGD